MFRISLDLAISWVQVFGVFSLDLAISWVQVFWYSELFRIGLRGFRLLGSRL